MANAKRKPTLAEELQVAADGAGINNRVPPRVAAGATPRKPWTLTEEFNKRAKKPIEAAKTPDTRKQIAQLRKQMQAAVKKTGQDNQKRSGIASQQGIDALRKKLSQPRNTWELTPLGSVTRGYNPNRDRQLIREIKQQQTALAKNQGKAKSAFNRSSGISR